MWYPVQMRVSLRQESQFKESRYGYKQNPVVDEQKIYQEAETTKSGGNKWTKKQKKMKDELDPGGGLEDILGIVLIITILQIVRVLHLKVGTFLLSCASCTTSYGYLFLNGGSMRSVLRSPQQGLSIFKCKILS
jgi:hypothetical protein